VPVDRTSIAGPVSDATQLQGVCPEAAIVLQRVLRFDDASEASATR
jgi:hypothetical protein